MGLFGGGNSSTQSQTDNYTTTTTQDRRAVADGGSSVISADNSTIFTTDNGAVNSSLAAMLSIAGGAIGWNSNVATNIADASIGAQRDVAINVAQNVSNLSSHLGDVSLAMLQGSNALTNSLATKAFDTSAQQLGLNTSLAASLTNGTNNLVTHLMDTAAGLYRDASSKDASVVGIAQDLAKTQVAAQNDNRYIIAAALAVVCIVGVMAFKGKA